MSAHCSSSSRLQHRHWLARNSIVIVPTYLCYRLVRTCRAAWAASIFISDYFLCFGTSVVRYLYPNTCARTTGLLFNIWKE